MEPSNMSLTPTGLPKYDNRKERYQWFKAYLKHIAAGLLYDNRIFNFSITDKHRTYFEHFIDKESRETTRPKRQSEYKLELLLKQTGTVRPEFISGGKFRFLYDEVLWLYNICVVVEFNPRLKLEAKKDLEALICQYHKKD